MILLCGKLYESRRQLESRVICASRFQACDRHFESGYSPHTLFGCGVWRNYPMHCQHTLCPYCVYFEQLVTQDFWQKTMCEERRVACLSLLPICSKKVHTRVASVC
ncbi:unnamed protein product [Ixodes pacificus]